MNDRTDTPITQRIHIETPLFIQKADGEFTEVARITTWADITITTDSGETD